MVDPKNINLEDIEIKACWFGLSINYMPKAEDKTSELYFQTFSNYQYPTCYLGTATKLVNS